jgi:very-short-patch-repair endonuclease
MPSVSCGITYVSVNSLTASSAGRRPIGNYIVDFVCFEHRLIVELDGSQHAIRVEDDERRTAWLGAQVFRILRFWNNQVLEEREAVLEVICRALPPPALPHEGGGRVG